MIHLSRVLKSYIKKLSTLQVLVILLISAMGVYGSVTFPSYLSERKKLLQERSQLLMDQQSLEVYKVNRIQWKNDKDELDRKNKEFEKLFPYYEGDYIGLEYLKNKIETYPISNLQVSFNETTKAAPFCYSTYNFSYTTQSTIAKQMLYDVVKSWGGISISKLEWSTKENGEVEIQITLEAVTRNKEEV